jgi:hypothetical protein
MRYEFISRQVQLTEDDLGKIERTCNEWAKDGWEVFSVIVPQGSNYHTYRLTAKRQLSLPNPTGRRFR